MNADSKAPRNSLAPNNATIRHEEVETFETRSCITNITDCFVPLVSYVFFSFCLLRFVPVLFDFCLPIYTLLAVSLAYSIRLLAFVRRPSTEAPSAKDVGDMVAYVMPRAIRRITPRRLRARHRSGASIFERASHTGYRLTVRVVTHPKKSFQDKNVILVASFMMTVFHALLLYSRYLNTRLINYVNLLFSDLSNP